MCLVQGRAFDDAGTGAITITLGDTPAIHGQKACLKEGEFWHNDRLWASHPCTTVFELQYCTASQDRLPKSTPFETATFRI